MIAIRKSRACRILCVALCIGVYYVIYKYNLLNLYQSYDETQIPNSNIPKNLEDTIENSRTKTLEPIVIAVVACGKRLNDTLSMIKSSLIYPAKSTLRFIIIADEDLLDAFSSTLKRWQSIVNDSFYFDVLPLKFPEKEAKQWKRLFKMCASQRLFLPSLLPDVDSLLYLDTDTLFLSSVDLIWNHFKSFNSSHMAALVLEHEDPNVSWYSRFAKHPYYGKLGVNSGVMLMNLTRMRSFHWEDYVSSIYHQWKKKLTWGDQDIINIIFHYHSDKLFIMDCSYNYRPDHCMYGSACPMGLQQGAKILHGSRETFHYDKQFAFSVVYDTVSNYQLGSDFNHNYLQPLLANIKKTAGTHCGKISNVFTLMAKTFNDALKNKY